MKSYFEPRSTLLREMINHHQQEYDFLRGLDVKPGIEEAEKRATLYQLKQDLKYFNGLLEREDIRPTT